MITARFSINLKCPSDELSLDKELSLAFVPVAGMFYNHHGYGGPVRISEVTIAEDGSRVGVDLEVITLQDQAKFDEVLDDFRERGWKD
ncbi:MAG TPA: hypothetical protein PLB89_04860 [Flavobacteriales bacterium]|nr:hypothetical protein [Flavobacteriales bacterium]